MNGANTPIPDLFNVVGEELHHLASAVERLHDIVELPGVKQSLQDAKCFDVLQGIDHVTQHLVALSEFFDALNEKVPGHWTLDTGAASEAILIASLQARLRCPTTPRPTAAKNDDCEFF